MSRLSNQKKTKDGKKNKQNKKFCWDSNLTAPFFKPLNYSEVNKQIMYFDVITGPEISTGHGIMSDVKAATFDAKPSYVWQSSHACLCSAF